MNFTLKYQHKCHGTRILCESSFFGVKLNVSILFFSYFETEYFDENGEDAADIESAQIIANAQDSSKEDESIAVNGKQRNGW